MSDKLCCQHLKPEDLDSELVVVRDSIARELGLSPDRLPINSGARCIECNRLVGGSEHSVHVPKNNFTKKSEAMDIGCIDSHLRFEIVKKLLLRGFVRIEWGTKTWIHADRGSSNDGYSQRTMFLG